MIAGTPVFRARMETARRTFLESLDTLRTKEQAPGRLGDVEQIAAAELAHHEHVIAFKESQRTQLVETFEDELSPLRDAVVTAFDRLDGLERRAADHAIRAAHRAADRARIVVLAVSASAFVGMLLMAFLQLREGRRDQELIDRWTDFLSMASHDFKSFLQTLTLRIDVTKRALKRQVADSENVLSGVAQMEKQVAGMEALITRVLDLTRLQLGALPFELSEVDLSAVISEVAARFEPQFETKGTELKLALEPAVVGVWDRLRLDQVVSNLVSNALKYGGGRPVEVTLRADVECAELRVTDLGPGIPVDEQKRIFQRYMRAKGEHGAGHGLGLWITQSIVEALGGRITLVSAPGSGSTFVVELPRRRPRRSERVAAGVLRRRNEVKELAKP